MCFRRGFDENWSVVGTGLATFPHNSNFANIICKYWIMKPKYLVVHVKYWTSLVLLLRSYCVLNQDLNYIFEQQVLEGNR